MVLVNSWTKVPGLLLVLQVWQPAGAGAHCSEALSRWPCILRAPTPAHAPAPPPPQPPPQDMLLSVLRSNRTADEQFHPPVLASAIRLGLFGAATLLALTAYQVLGATLSLLGGLASISCSLLLPTAFYASLSWRRQGWAARAGLAALLALGAALIALVTTTSLCDMTQRCGAHHGGGGNAWGGVLALAAA